ncbi:uncharacterized protein DFL_005013 [Arthrobotrys flagrans]|uniref:Uncharacterized protein n=1 Tax=Arthrobotrys flagrans TaxID=97331 RepID=A0A437A6I0_ARTFL|nr:hypothetical protein DFL_005013 [Arthrobotrys flagrans]
MNPLFVALSNNPIPDSTSGLHLRTFYHSTLPSLPPPPLHPLISLLTYFRLQLSSHIPEGFPIFTQPSKQPYQPFCK